MRKLKVKDIASYPKSPVVDLSFITFSANVTELSSKLRHWQNTPHERKNEYQKFYSGQLLKTYLYLNVQ